MSKHTPAPWEVDAMGNIWAEDTKVAEMSAQPTQDDFHYRRKSTEEHEANAEHIVKCVNYHDRLVEALEAAMDYIDKSPCDPDIFLDQIEAHMKLCDIDPKALLSELSAHNGEGGE